MAGRLESIYGQFWIYPRVRLAPTAPWPAIYPVWGLKYGNTQVTGGQATDEGGQYSAKLVFIVKVHEI